MKNSKWAVVLFLLLCVNQTSANPLTNSLFTNFQEYLHQGKSDKALYLLRNKTIELVGVDKELARFAQGVLSFKKGQYEEAISEFNSIENLPELKEYIDYYKAFSYFYLGKVKAADKICSGLLKKAGLNRELQEQIKYLQGRIDIKLNRGLAAYKNLNFLISKWKGSYKREELLLTLMEASLQQQLFSKGRYCTWFEILYREQPGNEEVLHWGFNEQDLTLKGKKIDCELNLHDKKKRLRTLHLQGLDSVIEKDLEEYKNKDIYKYNYLHSYYLYLNGDHDKATAYFLNSKKENESLDFNDNVYLAILYYYAGEPEKSIAIYESLFEDEKKYSRRSWLLYKIGFIHTELTNYKIAEIYFEKNIKEFPKSRYRVRSEWYLAWSRYLTGKHQEAYRDFLALIEKTKKNPQRYKDIELDKAFYWAARSVQKSGQEHLAAMIYKELAKDQVMGYYAILSSMRLEEMAKNNNILLSQKYFLTPPWMEFNERKLAEVSEFFDSIKLSSRMPSAVSVGFLPNGLPLVDYQESFPKKPLKDLELEENEYTEFFKRYAYFMRIGFVQEAAQEIDHINRYAKTKVLKRKLLSYFLSVKDFSSLSRLVSLSFYRERLSENKKTAFDYWTYAYPKAFENYVKQSAGSFKISKSLIWAVMRAESFFDPKIVSPVGAKGLLQVMPYTGIKIHSLLEEKNPLTETFQVSEQKSLSEKLTHPKMNIKLGTRYLQRLSKEFNGHLPFMIAAYNGGPHRVKMWSSRFGKLSQDEFIEQIPFSETQNYVKKVLRNTFIYSHLYEDDSINLNFLIRENIPYKHKGPVPTKEYWGKI